MERHQSENVAMYLKRIAPITFEKFRTEYLSKHYEFWEHNTRSEKTLWFCERNFLTQSGYFLDWLSSEYDIYIQYTYQDNVEQEVIKEFFKLEQKIKS